MKYGYARVSTAQQKKDGNSLEEQCNHLQAVSISGEKGAILSWRSSLPAHGWTAQSSNAFARCWKKGTRWWCASSTGLPGRWWRELPPAGS